MTTRRLPERCPAKVWPICADVAPCAPAKALLACTCSHSLAISSLLCIPALFPSLFTSDYSRGSAVDTVLFDPSIMGRVLPQGMVARRFRLGGVHCIVLEAIPGSASWSGPEPTLSEAEREFDFLLLAPEGGDQAAVR